MRTLHVALARQVIEALNNNMRFDQSTLEQVAGGQSLATGLSRYHPAIREGVIVREEYAAEC